MARAWADQSLLERMVTAVERVRDRLERATAALEAAGVPYAICGGNAVAVWVATVDPAAVRNTADVDVLLRRADLSAAARAMAAAGFEHAQVSDVDMFIDAGTVGPKAGPRDAVHVLFANEKVRDKDLVPTPDVGDSVRPDAFRLVDLDAIVRMKLTSFRRKDQVHLLDMLGVGLIDATWVPRLPAGLGERLQHLIDTPEG